MVYLSGASLLGCPGNRPLYQVLLKYYMFALHSNMSKENFLACILAQLFTYPVDSVSCCNAVIVLLICVVCPLEVLEAFCCVLKIKKSTTLN